METIIILIKLLCAHLCSDFILQTDNINNGKRKSGIKGLGYLLLHSAIHTCMAYVLVADWSCWLDHHGIYINVKTIFHPFRVVSQQMDACII